MTKMTTDQQNTFTGMQLTFPNEGIHALIAQAMKFRKQLTVRTEFRSQSGWDNATNSFMVKELEQLNNGVARIAYNPDDRTQEQIEADAASTVETLADSYGINTLSTDNLMMPPSRDRNIVHVLNGTDPDIPQMTPMACPNDTARIFITALDDFMVEASRLDSRFQSTCITKYEAGMLKALLERLYSITQNDGGEDNRSDIPNGTMPSQEPWAFNNENRPTSWMPERVNETSTNVAATRHDQTP